MMYDVCILPNSVYRKGIGRNNTTPIAVTSPVLRLWSVSAFPTKENQDSLEKWLSQSLGQGIYKMNLEHLPVIQTQDAFKH